MTNLKALLSANIKERRKFLGLSQAVLAEKVGTSTHYIGQIEQQNRFPSYDMMGKLAVALEFDTTDLFSKGLYSDKAIQQFQDGLKTDFERRLKSLVKSKNKNNPCSKDAP